MTTPGYNFKDLVQEAQIRWLRPGEVFFILQNFEETHLNQKLPQKPPSGSLFLFNKRVLRFFRKDGHNWRRKKDGRTVGEAHERLKVGNAEALNCYYAHGEQNPNFQRRCYWMLDQGMDHIVLVHYRDIGIRMASGHSSGSISTFTSGSSTLTQGSNSDASQFTQSAAAFSQFPELSDSILSSSSTEVSSNVVARSYVAGPLGLTQGFEKIGGSPSSEIDQALRSIKKELDIDDDTLKDTSAFDNPNEPDDFKYSAYTPARKLSESYQDFYSTTLESNSSLQEQKFTPSWGHATAHLTIPSSHVPNISKRLVASSSPYSQSMLVSSHSRDYDVLLSYRGQDTRRTLVGHLYTALQQQGISTYLDNDDHVSSSEVSEQSEIAVIVFSKNYADSLRCLDQLAYIMKCREERGQTNLSVFYDVDPSEVIDQGRKYKEAFQIRELENEKIVESWRKSLTDAACISGWHVDCQPFDGQESRCIEEIVDTISRKLHPVLSSSNEDLIRPETRTQDQKSSSSQSVRASYSHSSDYDVISFREDTRVTFDNYLYPAPKQESNYAYKYDATLKQGASIISLLFNTIEESKIAVIVFSNNYTDAFRDCNIPIIDYKLLLKGYKNLLHLSCIDLSYVHGMVTTPDFGGLPCVQVLKLHYCSSLEDIHSSLGHHASLVYLSVHHCHKLKMIPTIAGMKKLKTLEILDCDALHEFPEIHAIIDRHWSIFTADTIAEFSPGSSSWTSSYSLPAVYSQWRNHDVFLSFIGEYDSKAFVDHLYSTFIQQGIHVYKPDKLTPSPGDSIGMSLKNAIEDSQIVIIIFTTNYAGSSRCLDELSYIMKCIDMRGLHVMPIFYDVSSSDVQKQSGAFGKEFDKQELENMAKVESWRKALNGVCKHSGWSLKHIANRNESRHIKDIVATVSHRLFFLNSNVKKDLIGIGPRLESLTSELAIGSDDVRMVVVGGIGGSGKTTIAYCVYMEISRQFEGRCFVENVRGESSKYGIKKLQQKLLSTILKKEVNVPNDEEGKHMMQSMLCHRKVLIVLDDVNDPRQLESLAGSHEWFGGGSRIIITSREGTVLLSKVDALYDVSLLSNDEAIKLFRTHAYIEYNLIDKGQWRPSSSFVEAYDMLSQNVTSYAYGLPLTLKVLGSFLYEKGKDEWEGALAKLRDVSNPSTIDKLKISYDGLQPDEKELFLDIACFFKGAFVDSLRTLLDTFSFHPFKRVNVLVKRGLISITNGMFDMHDLIEEMAHQIVREGHPTHPQKHSRVWQWNDVVKICATDTTEEFNNIQALYAPKYDAPSNLLKAVANMKNLQLLNVRQHVKEVVEETLFLSNELRWISWENYPASSFPTSFQPELLFSLILRNGLQRVLWQGFKRLPRLKVLDLHGSKSLIMTPDFGGLPNLERLVLCGCSSLKEIGRSIGYHERLIYLNLDSCEKLETFPPILWMPKLETLILSRCSSLLKFPEIKRTMNGLKHLYMDYSGIDVVPSTVGQYCTKLVSINLIGCDNLKRIEGNFKLFKQRCVILVDAHDMRN